MTGPTSPDHARARGAARRAPPCSLHATGANQHQARNRRRRSVLPRRSDEAGRGRRLFHVLDQQTHFTHHVYISAQWAVHEGQIDPGGDLFEGGVVVDVWPDPPVLLPRIWSSIQPLPGVWSSGWFRSRRKRPPGARTRAISWMHGSIGSM